MSNWYVYIVRCADSSFYTGIAVDVDRRIDEHNAGRAAGARYTRGRRPVRLVYQERHASRSSACRREYEIKRLSRREKEILVAEGIEGS
ncbi:MAG TPA: GIY-YIG nuclease family protein [Gammaproteobacteria bacterium]|nr:GIY-YIG nuclease family protein [Gammaproteobacteria bacterium]